MPADIKVEKTFYAAEDKWEPNAHIYQAANGQYGREQFLSEQIRSVHLSTHPKEGNQLVINVKGSAGRDARATLTNVLAAAGLQVEKESPRETSAVSAGSDRKDTDFSLKIDRTEEDAVIRVMHEMFKAGVISRDVASQIEAMERERLIEAKISPVQAKLMQLETEAMTGERRRDLGLTEPVSYVTATINNPFLEVLSLREDGYLARVGDTSVMEIKTRIDVQKDSGPKLLEALKAAGIPAGKLIHNADGDAIYAGAPADAVAKALKKADMLPGYFADVVAEKAFSLHPEQEKTNQSVRTVAASMFLTKTPPAAETPTVQEPVQASVQNKAPRLSSPVL